MRDRYGDSVALEVEPRYVYLSTTHDGVERSVELTPHQARKLAKKLKRAARVAEDLNG